MEKMKHEGQTPFEGTTTQIPSFDLLMEKFQFHNSSVHFHAELAKRVADLIRDEYREEAEKSGYFTKEFFEQNDSEIENKADEERMTISDEPQASESAAENGKPVTLKGLNKDAEEYEAEMH